MRSSLLGLRQQKFTLRTHPSGVSRFSAGRIFAQRMPLPRQPRRAQPPNHLFFIAVLVTIISAVSFFGILSLALAAG